MLFEIIWLINYRITYFEYIQIAWYLEPKKLESNLRISSSARLNFRSNVFQHSLQVGKLIS